MGKYVNKINEYLSSHQDSIWCKMLKYFAPLLIITFIKLIMILPIVVCREPFLDEITSDNTWNLIFCLLILPIFLYLFLKNRKHVFLKLLMLPFLLFIIYLSPVLIIVLMFIIFGFGCVFAIVFSIFIYNSARKNEAKSLCSYILNLKQSFVMFVFALFLDALLVLLAFKLDSTCQWNGWYFISPDIYESFVMPYYSCFYITFFLLNLGHYIKSKVQKLK